MLVFSAMQKIRARTSQSKDSCLLPYSFDKVAYGGGQVQTRGTGCSLFRILVTVLSLVSFLLKAELVKVTITWDLCMPLPQGL